MLSISHENDLSKGIVFIVQDQASLVFSNMVGISSDTVG